MLKNQIDHKNNLRDILKIKKMHIQGLRNDAVFRDEKEKVQPFS